MLEKRWLPWKHLKRCWKPEIRSSFERRQGLRHEQDTLARYISTFLPKNAKLKRKKIFSTLERIINRPRFQYVKSFCLEFVLKLWGNKRKLYHFQIRIVVWNNLEIKKDSRNFHGDKKNEEIKYFALFCSVFQTSFMHIVSVWFYMISNERHSFIHSFNQILHLFFQIMSGFVILFLAICHGRSKILLARSKFTDSIQANRT